MPSSSYVYTSLETDTQFCGYWHGNVNCITFTGANRTHTDNEILFTLSEQFRPSYDIYVIGMIGTTPCMLRIYRSTGEVKLYLAENYNITGRIRFTATYLYSPM